MQSVEFKNQTLILLSNGMETGSQSNSKRLRESTLLLQERVGGCVFREGLPKHALFPHRGIG